MIAKKPATFCNPFWPENFPDPFVLKVRGRYYAYGSEYGMLPPPASNSKVFPVLASTDLVHWSSVGKAMPALGDPYFGYWAPEVIVHNSQFLLYYAVHIEEFVCSIRAAVADRPEGPFVDSGHDLTSHLVPWAIDPHIFRNQDGQWYLYMTIEFWDNPEGFIGVGNVVDRLVDPFTLQGRLTQVTPPRHAWQLYQAKRPERGGVDWYTVEGPTVVRHRKRYYEMFSGGCYYRDNYAVSYAISDTPMGPGGMQDASWRDWEGNEGNAFLIRGDQAHVMSPGHNSFVLGPNNADMYIAYHVLQPDMIERRPCLDRLFWHGDDLWTPAPTYTPQPVPALPRLHEFFETPSLAPSWSQQGGRWRAADGEVIQEDDAGLHASLRYQEPLSTAWLLEVNLRNVAGDGRYGVLLESDAGAVVWITITPDSRLVVCLGASPAEPVQTMPLPREFAAKAWHQLIVSFSGSVLSVQLDYLQALEVITEGRALTFALLTEGCSAAFSAISLTDHFRDEFLNAERTPALLGWNLEPGSPAELADTSLSDWRVQDGVLEQISTRHGAHSVLKGPFHEQYEFGATIMLHRANEDGQLAFGLVVWHSREEKRLVLLLQEQAHWTLTVESGVPAGNIPTGNASLDLSTTFDPFHWHTLRLVGEYDQLTVYLDGPEVLAIPVPRHPQRLGLVTRNVAAAFKDVWQTGRPPG